MSEIREKLPACIRGTIKDGNIVFTTDECKAVDADKARLILGQSIGAGGVSIFNFTKGVTEAEIKKESTKEETEETGKIE